MTLASGFRIDKCITPKGEPGGYVVRRDKICYHFHELSKALEFIRTEEKYL